MLRGDERGGKCPLQQEELAEVRARMGSIDPRTLNPLQRAYVGDTIHDLYVRSLLLARGMGVGAMHKRAVRLVSAAAQARMLDALEPMLTQEEADIARRGRNAQARHAAPRHADPADYARATGLEALWGYLYITGQNGRLDALMAAALEQAGAHEGAQAGEH